MTIGSASSLWRDSLVFLRSKDHFESGRGRLGTFEGIPEIQEDLHVLGCRWGEKIAVGAVAMALSVDLAISRFTKSQILLHQHIAKSQIERMRESLVVNMHAVPIQFRLTYYRPD